MKKTSVFCNAIIAIMLISLVGIAFSNSRALNVSADSRVIYAGNENSNNIALMFNVYQNEENVIKILEILDVYNAKATFFVGGCWVVKNVDVLKQIYAHGHEIGNHGFYHKQHSKLNLKQNVQEIEMCHKVVSKNLGFEMQLFAPPSGDYNSTTVDAAESLGYKTIMWTTDTIDWRDQDADLIFKRATKNMAGGNLILMHPTNKTVEALTSILAFAVNNGFTPTTVSNCVK